MIHPENFTRINNDVNGNPRYVCHYLHLMTKQESENQSINPMKACYYQDAVKRANSIGGRKYHTKSYGGGIVFQSYNLQVLCNRINELTK
jgi:hypothetical protein